MKTFEIPETRKEAPRKCPFGCGAGLHPSIHGRIFNSGVLPQAIAGYFCGTYIWDNGEFDLGSDCIGLLKRKQ